MNGDPQKGGKVPAALDNLDVGGWLRAIGLGQYEQVFEQKGITPRVLVQLADEDLKDLGVAKLVHRANILAEIEKLTAGAASAKPATPKVATPATVPPGGQAPDFSSLPLNPMPPVTGVPVPVARIASGVRVAAVQARPVAGTVPVFSPPSPVAPQKTNRKRRLGGKFLVISIALHLLFALGAAYYVVQTITAKRKLTFHGGPPSPNPSQRAIEHKVQMAKKQNSMSAPPPVKRIVTTGMAKVALPDMPSMPTSNPVAATKAVGAGGVGVGFGPSVGAASASAGGGSTISFFGLRTQGTSALVGTFYDLKQDKNRKPTSMDPGKYASEVLAFVKAGWGASHFNKYYKGPDPLYATQVFTPNIPAELGPQAFGLEKEVKPSLWLVLYKGNVTAPESGVFHFVGAGDDVMMVRFNGKLVLDRGWNFGTGWKPVANYDYGFSTIKNGFAKGDGCQVEAGHVYAIEVLIGEQPGGLGYASLLIEKDGVQYQKDKKGNPILPVFRVADTKPPSPGKYSYPPHTEDGPIWKSVGGGDKPFSGLDALKATQSQ